jgi:hypothetical protein
VRLRRRHARPPGLALDPGYCLGRVGGTRPFSRLGDMRFRQLTLMIMMVVAAGIPHA